MRCLIHKTSNIALYDHVQTGFCNSSRAFIRQVHKYTALIFFQPFMDDIKKFLFVLFGVAVAT